MRVLFLDIDGVLRPGDWVDGDPGARRSEGDCRVVVPDPTRPLFYPACVARLNGVLARTQARVVLSSAWRIAYGWRETRATLVAGGLSSEHAWLGETPVLWGARGEEIAAWLARRHDVEAFAILDDDRAAGSVHPDRFVQTGFATGLQDEHAARLVALLGAREVAE